MRDSILTISPSAVDDGASKSSPDGDGRGPRSSRRGCTRCAPVGRVERSRHVWTCKLMSSARRTPRRPRRGSIARTRRADRDTLRSRSILVEPLCRHVQFHALATRVRHSQRSFETEKRLVLHPDLIGALDDHVARNGAHRHTRCAGGESRSRRDGSEDGCRRSPAPGRAAGRASRSRTIASSARRQVSGMIGGDGSVWFYLYSE